MNQHHLRLITAHSQNQVTKPRSFPRFKRQLVPECAIIIKTPPSRSRGNGSAHFHRSKLQSRAVCKPPLTLPHPHPHLHLCSHRKPMGVLFLSQNDVHFLFPLQLGTTRGKRHYQYIVQRWNKLPLSSDPVNLPTALLLHNLFRILGPPCPDLWTQHNICWYRAFGNMENIMMCFFVCGTISLLKWRYWLMFWTFRWQLI